MWCGARRDGERGARSNSAIGAWFGSRTPGRIARSAARNGAGTSWTALVATAPSMQASARSASTRAPPKLQTEKRTSTSSAGPTCTNSTSRSSRALCLPRASGTSITARIRNTRPPRNEASTRTSLTWRRASPRNQPPSRHLRLQQLPFGNPPPSTRTAIRRARAPLSMLRFPSARPKPPSC